MYNLTCRCATLCAWPEGCLGVWRSVRLWTSGFVSFIYIHIYIYFFFLLTKMNKTVQQIISGSLQPYSWELFLGRSTDDDDGQLWYTFIHTIYIHTVSTRSSSPCHLCMSPIFLSAENIIWNYVIIVHKCISVHIWQLCVCVLYGFWHLPSQFASSFDKTW